MHHIPGEFRQDIAEDTPGGQVTRRPIFYGPLYASPLRGARIRARKPYKTPLVIVMRLPPRRSPSVAYAAATDAAPPAIGAFDGGEMSKNKPRLD